MTTELTKIERSTRIGAPRDRVWQAITNPADFAKWFRVEFTGNFEPGARIEMVSTHPECPGVAFFILVGQVTPYTFSWRWYPGMPEAGIDYSKEPMTLVEFRLEEAGGETLVTVTESGFDQIAPARRAAMFAQNDEGWRYQLVELSGYVRDAT